MKIGAFSQATGLPASTLHFYERKGLLHPARGESGHREYDEADLAWVAFIERLKATGMPLSQIGTYADLRRQGDSSIPERLELLREHRASVLAAVERCQDNLAHLDAKIAHYEELAKAAEPAAVPGIGMSPSR